jgi:hypothetical protein
VLLNQIFVAQFQIQQTDDTYTCPQGEILKPYRRWHKKSGRTEQSGYQFKNTEQPAKCPVKPFIPVEQQVEKLTEASMRSR